MEDGAGVQGILLWGAQDQMVNSPAWPPKDPDSTLYVTGTLGVYGKRMT